MASLLARLFGLHNNRRDARWEGPSDPILPTRDTRPAPAPPESDTSTLPPLKNWCHPFKDKRDPLAQLTHMANAAAGYYPLGRGGLFHGGVHFDGGTAGILDQSSVHCLADGEVVAYRIDTHAPTTHFVNAIPVAKPFSRNFVLVRHRLQPPKIEGSQDIPPSLTFYSLYMHLQDWADYRHAPAVPRPAFWPQSPTLRVKQTANDIRPGHPEQPGLNVRHAEHHGKVIDLLPRGAEVTVSGTGRYRKLENRPGPAELINVDGSLAGYIHASLLQPMAGNEYRITSSKERVNVRAEPKVPCPILLELPTGSVVTVSGEGEFRKLERVHQYVYFDSLEGAQEPLATDRIVALDQPVPIKAGDLIGHLGQYQGCNADQPDERLHLETFSGDDVEAFIEASRDWAKRLPDKHKTWLKLAKGTPVVPHEDHVTAALLKVKSEGSPVSAADLLVPKSLLDGLPADRKIHVPDGGSHNARRWYRLDGLLHDGNNNLLNGWVCEEVGVTPWFSSWAWEGYKVIIDYSRPKHLLASFLSAVDGFSDAQQERYRPIAEKDDKGPMKSRLYEIIGRNRDGKMTATELKAALERPAHAQSISQMILYKESEWFHQPKVWDALDELLGHSGSTPHLNWLAEKQRIAQLGWWRDVAEKVGLPSWGSAYHFHPIGLMGIFCDNRFKFFLEVMKSIYPKLGEDRHGDLQKIADELNANIDFFKLDTPLRRTHFFAQIQEETGVNLTVDEDFSYEANALINMFSYFRNNPEEARRYGYKVRRGKIKENGLPMTRSDYEAIANGAYGGREELGNRGISSGDGWKYRGRGMKQLTGRHNYTQFQLWHSKFSANWPSERVDFIVDPDLLLEMKYAIRSAASFWLNNRLHEIADKGDAPESVDTITAIVNKHTKSYPDRRENFIELSRRGTLN
jgi:predicted chitinase